MTFSKKKLLETVSKTFSSVSVNSYLKKKKEEN